MEKVRPPIVSEKHQKSPDLERPLVEMALALATAEEWGVFLARLGVLDDAGQMRPGRFSDVGEPWLPLSHPGSTERRAQLNFLFQRGEFNSAAAQQAAKEILDRTGVLSKLQAPVLPKPRSSEELPPYRLLQRRLFRRSSDEDSESRPRNVIPFQPRVVPPVAEQEADAMPDSSSGRTTQAGG